MVKDMVENEMKKENCLILAVAKAHGEIKMHEVLGLSGVHDESGKRTIAVITKPDVDLGILRAPDLIKMIQEQNSELEHKNMWHVLRNRKAQEQLDKISSTDRDRNEKNFFDQLPWSELEAHYKCVEPLLVRLRQMIFAIATKDLPKLRKAMKSNLTDLRTKLMSMGGHNLNDKQLIYAFKQAITRLKNKLETIPEESTSTM